MYNLYSRLCNILDNRLSIAHQNTDLQTVERVSLQTAQHIVQHIVHQTMRQVVCCTPDYAPKNCTTGFATDCTVNNSIHCFSVYRTTECISDCVTSCITHWSTKCITEGAADCTTASML